jgi:hypothetical protein
LISELCAAVFIVSSITSYRSSPFTSSLVYNMSTNSASFIAAGQRLTEMKYIDPDYELIEDRTGSRIGCLYNLAEIHENTRDREKSGRLQRRASDPHVGRQFQALRQPAQSDTYFEIRQFSDYVELEYRDHAQNSAPIILFQMVDCYMELGT